MASPSDVQVEVLSPLKRLYPNATPRVERIYHRLLRHAPRIWGAVYDRPIIRRTLGAWGSSWFGALSDRLAPVVEEQRPDAVVCTQALPCLLLARYKARHGSPFRLFAVLTDHHPNAFWVDPAIDGYFIPSRHAADLLKDRGVKPERIHLSGIPVDPGLAPLNPAAKRELRLKLGLMADRPSVLIMGGSQGHIPARALAEALSRLPGDFQLTVLAGRNRRLYSELKGLEGAYSKPLKVFSYVHNAGDFLTSADALITKGGGLTTAEAVALGIPTVVLSVLPGQEDFNARILAGERRLRMASSVSEAAKSLEDAMREADAEAEIAPEAPVFVSPAIGIARRVLDLL